MAGTSVKGDMTLLVDELGLEAAFRFSPSSGGAEWTADGLARLLAEARVSGVSSRRLEEVLRSFAPAKAPVTEIVAKGQAPEAGLPEEAEWNDLETPPEYKPFEAESIAGAAGPELYRVRIERVARERTVKKAGAFPFMPSREEKTVEYEKVEVREPVVVDTRVIRSFWVPKGTLVARTAPARPGKPGKSVQGKPIPPGRDEDANFHIGTGLSREKGDIVSAEAGFVRVGARWADIVPFHSGDYAIRLSGDNSTVLLDYSPGDKRLPPPDAAAILQEAVELGQSVESLIGIEETASALLKATRSGQALTGYSLSGDRDAAATVEISPDKLKATLSVMKGRGKGKPLELSMVSAALSGHRLKGVKVDKLKADVLAFFKGKETELFRYPLAEGKDPVKGKARSTRRSPRRPPGCRALPGASTSFLLPPLPG